MKAEKEKLSRALTKELGEEAPLSKALDGSGDWRGRAQQISLLKAKISDLQQAQVSQIARLHRLSVSRAREAATDTISRCSADQPARSPEQ